MKELIKTSSTYMVEIVLSIMFLFFATWNINYPGLHYDEVLFVNAAIGGIDGSFILTKIGNFPVLLMQYIGALKSYLYMPIFWLFGVSPLTIRFPTILLTLLSLVLVYITVKKLFDHRTAFLTFALFALHPGIIVHSRLDIGPNAIEFFLKCFVLYLTALFLQKKKVLYLLIIGISLFAGTYNKLNFIWFVNAYVGAMVLLQGKDILQYLWTLIREKRILEVLFTGLTFIVPYAYYIFVNRKFGVPLVFSIEQLIRNTPLFFENLFGTITGFSMYNMFFGYIPWWIIVPLALFVTAINVGCLIIFLIPKYAKIVFNTSSQRIFYIVIAVIFLLNDAQVFITPQAVSFWHTFTIFPMMLLLLGIGISLMQKVVSIQYTKVFDTIFFAILVIFISINIIYQASYTREPKHIIWSHEIYTLAKEVKNEQKNIYTP